MTVNERLFVSGKLKEFDRAVAARNQEMMKEILLSLEVSANDVDKIIKTYGLG